MKSRTREVLNNIAKSEFFHLKNKRGNRTIYITLLLFILCVIILYRIKEIEVGKANKYILPQYANRFYGKVLFENGQPALIEPELWEGAKTHINLEPSISNNKKNIYIGELNKRGIFSVSLTEEILRQDDYYFTINCPCYDNEGGRIYKQVGKFPVKMLVNDESKPKEFIVARPKDINDCPITYVSEWKWLREYQDEVMKLHTDIFISNAEKIAENLDWGPSEEGLRLKLSCSNRDIRTADILYLLLYIQNVSQEDKEILNNIGKVIDITLNGKITGKGQDFGSRHISKYSTEYITIKPGEIVKVPLPVGSLSYIMPFSDTGGFSIYSPGTYDIQVIYSLGNSPTRQGKKIVTNELMINVEPRDKAVYEGEFVLGENLPVILYHGIESNRYLVKGQNIKFEQIDNNVFATLKVSFYTKYNFTWQTELEVLDDIGTVLLKDQRVDNNTAKANIVDRDFPFSLGKLSNISKAKKFRISFVPVEVK